MTSEIKVNNIKKASGSTITIGESGDTVSLASGASQTGFGRSGSVDWQTSSIKTSTFTATSGEGYFINSSSPIIVNLPSGTAGAIVAVSDYARNFATHNCKLSPNGSQKIGGTADDMILDVNGQSTTLVYVDDTKGWVNVQNAEDTQTGITPAFITATGGTITTVCTNFKVHTFTSPGTFCVSNAGNAAGSNKVSYMVIAGGGGGGFYGGGGGAGGYREAKANTCSYTASPLDATLGLSITQTAIPITVGAGGAGGPSSCNPGSKGSDSIFSSITSTGGGFGGGGPTSSNAGGPGGSGGAAAPGTPSGTGVIGNGNTPPVSPPQGNNGGTAHHEPGVYQLGGGGGGAGAVGTSISPAGPGATAAGAGGAGTTTSINATPTTRAGGGGGGSDNASRPAGAGGTGGGGAGGQNPSPNPAGTAGTANTGGGGGAGGGGGSATGAAGGSGIVIIRYKFQ